MPTQTSFGTPSAGNKSIGGVPTIHYFDWYSRGRGQAVRLLWEDAGIAYHDVRYTFEEFPEAKKSAIQTKNPTGNIPIVELNGKILTQSYAILRKMSRLLGKYDGETEDEKYWADVICDIVIDCMTPPVIVPSHHADTRILTIAQGVHSLSPHTMVPTMPSTRRRLRGTTWKQSRRI